MGVRIHYDELTSMKIGFDAVLGTESFSSVISQSLSGWMITLALWSLGTLCTLTYITSYLIYLISAFIGISAGISCTVMIYWYKASGMVYSLSYIIPVCIVRFFLWYVFLKVAHMIRCNSDNINGRRDLPNEKGLLIILVVMMLWDMISSVMGIVFSHIIF